MSARRARGRQPQLFEAVREPLHRLKHQGHFRLLFPNHRSFAAARFIDAGFSAGRAGRLQLPIVGAGNLKDVALAGVQGAPGRQILHQARPVDALDAVEPLRFRRRPSGERGRILVERPPPTIPAQHFEFDRNRNATFHTAPPGWASLAFAPCVGASAAWKGKDICAFFFFLDFHRSRARMRQVSSRESKFLARRWLVMPVPPVDVFSATRLLRGGSGSEASDLEIPKAYPPLMPCAVPRRRPSSQGWGPVREVHAPHRLPYAGNTADALSRHAPGLGLHQVLDRGAVDEITIGPQEGQEAHLCKIRIPLGQPQNSDIFHEPHVVF